VWIRCGEDGVKDRGEVESINRRSEGGCDNIRGLWKTLSTLFGKGSTGVVLSVVGMAASGGMLGKDLPFFYTVNLEIYPPDTRNAEDQP
jgi:hypothetical protein